MTDHWTEKTTYPLPSDRSLGELSSWRSLGPSKSGGLPGTRPATLDCGPEICSRSFFKSPVKSSENPHPDRRNKCGRWPPSRHGGQSLLFRPIGPPWTNRNAFPLTRELSASHKTLVRTDETGAQHHLNPCRPCSVRFRTFPRNSLSEFASICSAIAS